MSSKPFHNDYKSYNENIMPAAHSSYRKWKFISVAPALPGTVVGQGSEE